MIIGTRKMMQNRPILSLLSTLVHMDVAAVCLVIREEVWKVKHMVNKAARCNLTCTDQEGNISTKASGESGDL